jgi:cytochrome c553
VLFLVAGVVGFVWLPSAQPGASARSVDRHLSRGRLADRHSAGSVRAKVNRPRMSRGRPRHAAAGARRRRARAAIATACNNCHGRTASAPTRRSRIWPAKAWPRLYKQLEDYKSGKRDPMVMGVFVRPLSQQTALDLATHFASLPNPFGAAARCRSADLRRANWIEVGSPMRSIASCAACHGPMGVTTGAPELRGQQRAYLEQQMQAFKSGNRHNDISEQMRSVARQLTGEEIATLAAYYASFAGSNFSIGTTMLGFELDFWDYATFATARLAGFAGVLIYIWIAGLPGRIALARKHPEAEAVKIMGWAGLLPTDTARGSRPFIWAFKPTDIVDIRRFPKAEAKAHDEEEAARLSDRPVPARHETQWTAAVPPRDALAASKTAARRDQELGARGHAARIRPAVRLRLHRLARLLQVQMAQVHHSVGVLLDLLRAASGDHLPHRPAFRRADLDRRPHHPAGRSSSRRGCRSPRWSRPCWSSRTSTSSAARRCSSSTGASTRRRSSSCRRSSPRRSRTS